MISPFEIFLVFLVLGFWFLFPIGMYLSAEELEHRRDQILNPSEKKAVRIPVKVRKLGPRPSPMAHVHFRRWVRH